MKRDLHKIQLMRRVVNASRELFLAKGYAKTTISEITKKVGITTGSLYHFFKGKEDILRHLTQEVFDTAVVLSDAMLGKSSDPGLRFSFEIGIQLYLVQKYHPIAELYLAAHESKNIARIIVRSAQTRNQELFRSLRPDFTPDDYYAVALAIKGIIHSFIQDAVHNGSHDSPPLIFRAIEMVLMIFQIPRPQIEKTIEETQALIQKCSFQIYGFKVP